jgi:hypothetical protein
VPHRRSPRSGRLVRVGVGVGVGVRVRVRVRVGFASIWSPAAIMIALSRKPKPTKGIPIFKASRRSCCVEGGGAALDSDPLVSASAAAFVAPPISY